MGSAAEIVFYAEKKRLVHIALNIALAPLLLYLLRVWSWPPTVIQLGVFAITAVVAMRFYRARTGKPRLRFDDAGLHYKTSYAVADILGVKADIGALKIWMNEAQGPREYPIKLWWASKQDMHEIVRIASERYGLMDADRAS